MQCTLKLLIQDGNEHLLGYPPEKKSNAYEKISKYLRKKVVNFHYFLLPTEQHKLVICRPSGRFYFLFFVCLLLLHACTLLYNNVVSLFTRYQNNTAVLHDGSMLFLHFRGPAGGLKMPVDVNKTFFSDTDDFHCLGEP